MLVTPTFRGAPSRGRGVSMLEVLVAIFILTIGLLGAAGIQSQMQTAEIEAYQRAQAIVLLQDMVDRVNANRKKTDDYVTDPDDPLGAAFQDCTALGTIEAKDLCEWNNALFGSSETKGGVTYGAMSGARGCVTNPVATMPREVVVTVAWQGLRPTVAPADPCGKDLDIYGTDDRVRRVMSARIIIGCLQNDAATGLCVTP